MKRTIITLLCVALLLGAGVAYAQAPGQSAPPAQPAMTPIPANAVVMLYRCDVKPGHSVAQQKAAAATTRAIAKAPGGPNLLAMTAVTGSFEVWFLVPYNSLADVDKMYEAMAKAPAAQAELDQLNDAESAHYNTARGLLLSYREDLSLDASFNVAPYRGMVVTTYRVRPGREREFSEAAKKVLAAYKKLDIGLRMAGFEVIGGAPSGTFMMMRPIKTMTWVLPSDDIKKAFAEAMGGQEALDKMEKAMAEVIASSEDAIFTFSPKMSNVPASYAAADPFWRISAPAVAKAEPKKEGEPQKKPVEPAKKEPVKKSP